MIENDSKEDLLKEFVNVDDEPKSSEVKEIFSFTVAPGVFGETAITNLAGVIISSETSVGINMSMNSETYIRLVRAVSTHNSTNRGPN